MTDKFKFGDRVFAKMKGWPPWPALVRERIPGKAETYSVYFYGTYETAKIKPDCIFLYNEESKEKYGKLQRKARFKEAMIEMEDNIAIEEKTEEEYLAELKQAEPDVLDIPEDAPGSNHSFQIAELSDSEEGELLIDEGPPVLKKETKVSTSLKKPVKTSTPKRAPKGRQSAPTTPKITEPEEIEEIAPTPPPLKMGRRPSKGKRDSISIPTPEPKVETPTAPQPEIVSRSGRKIKPKRFADDEIQFGTKSSTSSPNVNDDVKAEGPPSAKRSKRVLSATPKAAASLPKVDTTPLPPPPRLEKAKPILTKASIEKKAEGSDVQPSAKVTPLRPPPPLRKFDAKPNLTPAPPPALKPAPSSKPPSLARLPPLVGRKSLPVLEPASELESPSSPIPEPSTSDAEENEDGEVFDPDSPADEEHELTTPASPPEEGETNEEDKEGEDAEEDQVDLELEDVESDEEMLSTDSDSPPTPSPVENGIKNSPPRGRPTRKRALSTYGYEPVDANMTKRMKVDLKNGASAVLSFNFDRNRPLLSGKSNLDWDIATAKNLLKAKSELENNPLPFMQRIVESMAEVDARAKIFKQSQITERVMKKIEQLRMEGELIEIVGEIVGCLNLNAPDCDRALDLLQRLITIGLNSLALKKHPEVVDTVRKLKNYHGNVSNWKLSEAQALEFNRKAQLIRDKSESIYEHLKSLFCSTPDKPFHEAFHEEVEKFKDLLADIPENQILGISTEPANRGRVNSMGGSRPNSRAKVEVKENHEDEEDEDEELEEVDSPDMDTDGLSPVSV